MSTNSYVPIDPPVSVPQPDLNFNSMMVQVSTIVLGAYASFVVFLYKDMQMVSTRTYTMTGEDYNNWGNDDQYVYTWIANKLRSEQRVVLVQEPVVVPVQEPVVVPVQEPVVVLVEEPVVAPIEEPVVVLVEEPVVISVEEPVVAPIEEPVVAPIEEPVVAPVEEPVVAPVE